MLARTTPNQGSLVAQPVGEHKRISSHVKLILTKCRASQRFRTGKLASTTKHYLLYSAKAGRKVFKIRRKTEEHIKQFLVRPQRLCLVYKHPNKAVYLTCEATRNQRVTKRMRGASEDGKRSLFQFKSCLLCPG